MKNKIIPVLLLILFIAYPVYASKPYTILLNGILYTPKYSAFELKDALYVSADDFISLTYSKIASDNKTHILTIQNNTIKFTVNERIVSINGKVHILVNMPLLLKGQIYLPIDLLNYIKYPYIIDKEQAQLTLTPAPPYSRTRDDYTTHLLTATSIANISETLKDLVTADTAAALLAEAKKTDSYLSFIDNTDKDKLLNFMDSDLLKNKLMQVSFREVDLLSTVPKISTLKTMPLKAKVINTDFVTEIGEDTITYNCIWAAYRPDTTSNITSNITPLKIDVSKSLDATLMRVLYEYYRDQYDLKDDLYFSPVAVINSDRSDYVSYTVYSDHITSQQNTFDIKIYRVTDEKMITYLVDFIKHQ